MSEQNQDEQKDDKKEIFQPDDRFFKKVMSQTENAKAHLETFYPEIAAIADLTTLVPENDEFLRSNLKLFKADIIYRCRIKDTDDHFYFSLIWEHKSIPEEEVAIQVGLYIFELLYKLSKSKKRKIEPVIPFIFYNGKENWQPKTVHQLFEKHAKYDFFQRFLPSFDFLFKNITKEPLGKLLSIEVAFFRSAMIAMANRFRPGNLIKQEYSIIFELQNKDDLYAFMTYFTAIIERSPTDIRKVLEEISFTTKTDVMSTLAMLREEGKIEGRKEGKIEGKVEGKVEGKTINSFITLLKFLSYSSKAILPDLEKLTGFKAEKIKNFLLVTKTKKTKQTDAYIKKEFLPNISLSQEEQKEISTLIKKLRQKAVKN